MSSLPIRLVRSPRLVPAVSLSSLPRTMGWENHLSLNATCVSLDSPHGSPLPLECRARAWRAAPARPSDIPRPRPPGPPLRNDPGARAQNG